MVEANLLQIPDGKVEQIAMLLDENEENLDDFIRNNLKSIRADQPHFHEFIATMARPDVRRLIPFTLGAVATYLMIGDELKKEVLGPEHFITVIETLNDQARTDHDTGEDFKWFYEKLKNNCPELTDYLSEIVFGLADQEDKEDFALGVFLAAMPFFMREEAKYLATKFGLA